LQPTWPIKKIRHLYYKRKLIMFLSVLFSLPTDVMKQFISGKEHNYDVTGNTGMLGKFIII